MRKMKIPGAESWQPAVDSDPERLKEGVAKMKRALEQESKREKERPSGLPKDWRERIIRQ